VKRHKTFFGFGFKSFFLDWLYFYFGFGFRLSVRNGFLYFVFGFGFYIFYFNFILATPPFYSVFPFYSVNKDQIIFICHPFATATATALALDPR
jgi:hypothetical protein